MKENTVVAFQNPSDFQKDPLTEVLQAGARELLAQAVEAEVSVFLGMVFDPIHYLPLLEHKIGALDQAAPLAGWELPDAFPTLHRLLEARMGKAGKREYVQVLRLLETFDLEVLHGAVKDALRLGAIGYDAVKHLVLCRIERRPPKLDLDIYPYLPRANVATTAAASYMSLLGGGAS